MDFVGTVWALLPPVIAIVLALITKEVYMSLFIGVVTGALLYTNFSPVGTIEAIFEVMMEKLGDSWNVGILIFLVFLGIIVALMTRAGGSAAYGKWAGSKIKTRSGALLSTFALGVVIFVDDYFNCLTVGNVMRPVTDKQKISRAKLAYIIDATAAPICIIAPISSWAAAVTGYTNGDGFSLFLQTIPFNLYAWLTILMVIFIGVTGLDYGPMKKFEENAAKGDLFSGKNDYENVKENIISAAHCATRLRLVISDNSKADKEYVENIEGVKGVFFAQGQMQIILGTGVVNKVYDEFIRIAGVSESSKEELKKVAASRANPVQRLIKTLGDIFVPIIPAIVASGFLMGIMEALNFMVNNGFLNIDTSGSIYTFAQLFSNTAYTFLPILIAYSGAKVFGANPYLGAVIGMIMIHPNLQNAWTVATEGVKATQKVWFGLYSIDMVGYQGHVIPVIIAVWVLAQIEKRLHKVVPAMFDLFVTPLVSVFVTGYLTLSIIGPIFVTVENGLLNGIQWLIALPFGIGSFIMGAFYAPTVVAGVHHMYTIIDLGQLSKFGVTYWLPLASAANIAQGGATLAVALKTKDQKIKSMAVPSALSACMGITEPAIFGVNLRFGKPFVMGCIGGAFGALFASVTGLGATGTGVTGIFGILLCLNNPVSYILMFVIAFGAAFVLTWLFGYKDTNVSEKTESVEAVGDKSTTEKSNADDSVLYSVSEGTAILLSQVNDATFASEVLGKGIAVIPSKGEVVAPCDAVVETVFDTKHAVGLSTESGMELLIHIGINTVELNGKYFTSHVKNGDHVKKGQLLVSFDMEKVKAAGYDVTTPLIVTNSDDYKDVKILSEDSVTPSDKVLEIVK